MRKKMSDSPRSSHGFEIGDVVRLVSGSPKMTVVAAGEDEIRLAWFTPESREIREARLHPDTLEHAKDYKERL